MYIAISGNIGSGKTSLVEILEHERGWKPFYERVDNPYLDDFYQDMNRWAFNLQINFLIKKTRQIYEITKSKDIIIQDRSIFEEAHVFVKNLNQMTLMSQRDYDSYMEMFSMLTQGVKQPDLVVYLKASVPTLISQIRKRGRSYEMSISPEYLERLNGLYNQWIESYGGRVITINIDETDFILESSMLDNILKRIDDEVAQILPEQI